MAGISLGGLGVTLSLPTPFSTPVADPLLTAAPVVINQAPINLGPLTTAFAPPAACTVAVQECRTCAQAQLAKGCDAVRGPMDAGSCWPGTSAGAPPAVSARGFYSPGVVCPAGYATACAATAGGQSGWPLQFRLEAGETAVGCCPSGFACANINGQTCIRIVSSTTLPTMSCRGNSAVFATMTLPDSGARVTSLSVYAPLIQLNFQSSDLTPTQTTIQNPSGDEQLTLAPGAPQSTGLGIGGRPTPTNTNGSPGSNSGSGFSVGAMVGVGVAGGLAFLAALVGGCWVWQRRLRQRRDRKDAAMQKLDNLYEASRPTALGGDGYSRYEVKPLPARPLGVDEYTMHSPVSPNTYVPTGRQYRPYRPSGF